jgi:hypothetical protein
MIRPTNDPNQTDLVAGCILDDLSPEEAACLNQALAEAPTLYEEIASFREAFYLIPYDMPILEPSERLKDKIISAASHSIADNSLESPHSKVVPIASPRHRTWKRWIPAISTGSRSGSSSRFEPSSAKSAVSADGSPSATARSDEC